LFTNEVGLLSRRKKEEGRRKKEEGRRDTQQAFERSVFYV
jgi:hypothetical protein